MPHKAAETTAEAWGASRARRVAPTAAPAPPVPAKGSGAGCSPGRSPPRGRGSRGPAARPKVEGGSAPGFGKTKLRGAVSQEFAAVTSPEGRVASTGQRRSSERSAAAAGEDQARSAPRTPPAPALPAQDSPPWIFSALSWGRPQGSDWQPSVSRWPSVRWGLQQPASPLGRWLPR